MTKATKTKAKRKAKRGRKRATKADAQGTGRKLSMKQQRFVLAYIGDANGNAAEAARLAGYSGKKPQDFARIGEETRRNPEITRAIDEALTKLQAEGMATATEVHTFFTETMRGKSDHFELNMRGEPVMISPPWKVRLGAAAELARVLGMAAPKKLDLDPNNKGTVGVLVYIPDNGRDPG